MKKEYKHFALKTPHAVTYGAGSLCRGESWALFLWPEDQERWFTMEQVLTTWGSGLNRYNL